MTFVLLAQQTIPAVLGTMLMITSCKLVVFYRTSDKMIQRNPTFAVDEENS